MKKGKDNNQENLPPSLFDNLDIFAPAPAEPPKSEARPRRQEQPPMPSQVYVRPTPVATETSGNQDFEDRLKRFMQESDSRIADSRMYADHRQRRRSR